MRLRLIGIAWFLCRYYIERHGGVFSGKVGVEDEYRIKKVGTGI